MTGEGREQLSTIIDVSRETCDRLDRFVERLVKWNSRLNLVSKSTLDDVWIRHILDSAQLYPIASKDFSHWLDLGSGGGFPGLVIASLAAQHNPGAIIELVEADQRKAAFLTTTARDLGLEARVHAVRAEALRTRQPDVITARALAPLDRLFGLVYPFVGPRTTVILPKGARFGEEIDAARRCWRFTHIEHRSITDGQARILQCQLQGPA